MSFCILHALVISKMSLFNPKNQTQLSKIKILMYTVSPWSMPRILRQTSHTMLRVWYTQMGWNVILAWKMSCIDFNWACPIYVGITWWRAIAWGFINDIDILVSPWKTVLPRNRSAAMKLAGFVSHMPSWTSDKCNFIHESPSKYFYY